MQCDDGALGVRARAEGERAPVALALALAVQGVDLEDAHVEHQLDGVVDLGLRGVGVDAKRVDVLFEQSVGLLGHERPDDAVERGGHASSPASSAGGAVSAFTATRVSEAGSDSAPGRVSCVNTT